MQHYSEIVAAKTKLPPFRGTCSKAVGAGPGGGGGVGATRQKRDGGDRDSGVGAAPARHSTAARKWQPPLSRAQLESYVKTITK
jgi:hypothetical protein